MRVFRYSERRSEYLKLYVFLIFVIYKTIYLCISGSRLSDDTIRDLIVRLANVIFRKGEIV